MTIIKSDIPFVTIAYNNYTFIKKYVEQVLPYTNKIIIIDNHSTYPPLLEYYKTITTIHKEISIIVMDKNYGHGVYCEEAKHLLPDLYCLSDPDIEFNKDLPDNFVDILINLSHKYKTIRVGFAIKLDYENFIKHNDFHIKIFHFESQYWVNKVNDSEYEMYIAPIDTTFSLINYAYAHIQHIRAIRVAGNFTCRHLPWYEDYISTHIPPDELQYWKTNNISSTILRDCKDI